MMMTTMMNKSSIFLHLCTTFKDRCLLTCQRDPLDEQFNELFAGISDELQNQIESDAAASGSAASECERDDDVLVAEYVSDEETTASTVTDASDEDFGDHVTKVCGEFAAIYCGIPCLLV